MTSAAFALAAFRSSWAWIAFSMRATSATFVFGVWLNTVSIKVDDGTVEKPQEQIATVTAVIAGASQKSGPPSSCEAL